MTANVRRPAQSHTWAWKASPAYPAQRFQVVHPAIGDARAALAVTDDRSSYAAYQSNTRKARSVFQRLGWPSPASISTGIWPGC